MAARIEAPQGGSTERSMMTKWCHSNQVDFRASPINSIADFLLYLFQDSKLQPSTIDWYRSATADKLGNSPIIVSKDKNLTRLLDNFHRDRPKVRRGIPSWNLSLVLHQLTKMAQEKRKTPDRLVQGVSLPLTQESAGQTGSRQCIAPVVISALAPILDKSLQADRSICPVRPLLCYLDWTSYLRQNKQLVFASFKKGFEKDISPATISSWIKQTDPML